MALQIPIQELSVNFLKKPSRVQRVMRIKEILSSLRKNGIACGWLACGWLACGWLACAKFP